MFAAVVALVCLGASHTADASFINYSAKEINVKIVYYGPGPSGRRNLEYIHGKVSPKTRGKLIKLATEDANVMFFDFVPLALGEIRGFKTRFHLYTIPSARNYSASRKLILKGVDGVVFVASAAKSQSATTLAHWKALKKDLAAAGYKRALTPIIIQLDSTGVKASPLSEKELRKLLRLKDETIVVAKTGTGTGVFNTIKAIAKLCLMALRDGASDPAKAP